MTVNIEGSALSIPKSLDSLKVTPLVMHRVMFQIANTTQWYAIMKEARTLYGKNWRGQPHVKRRLERNRWNHGLVPVWFEVPDPAFATWVAVKHAVIAGPAATK
jgi:hypothetical protein